MADVVLQAVGTDYGRVVRVIFALAQVRADILSLTVDVSLTSSRVTIGFYACLLWEPLCLSGRGSCLLTRWVRCPAL